jgi:hypothetical protein
VTTPMNVGCHDFRPGAAALTSRPACFWAATAGRRIAANASRGAVDIRATAPTVGSQRTASATVIGSCVSRCTTVSPRSPSIPRTTATRCPRCSSHSCARQCRPRSPIQMSARSFSPVPGRFLRRCGLAGAAGPLAPPGTTRVQGLGFRAFDDNRGFFDDNRHDESSPTCSNKCPSSRGRHAPTTAE